MWTKRVARSADSHAGRMSSMHDAHTTPGSTVTTKMQSARGADRYHHAKQHRQTPDPPIAVTAKRNPPHLKMHAELCGRPRARNPLFTLQPHATTTTAIIIRVYDAVHPGLQLSLPLGICCCGTDRTQTGSTHSCFIDFIDQRTRNTPAPAMRPIVVRNPRARRGVCAERQAGREEVDRAMA